MFAGSTNVEDVIGYLKSQADFQAIFTEAVKVAVRSHPAEGTHSGGATEHLSGLVGMNVFQDVFAASSVFSFEVGHLTGNHTGWTCRLRQLANQSDGDSRVVNFFCQNLESKRQKGVTCKKGRRFIKGLMADRK